MQVLATEDFDIKQSLSKMALVLQSVGWVGAALSELGQDACAGRRAWFPTHKDFAPEVALPMVPADGGGARMA